MRRKLNLREQANRQADKLIIAAFTEVQKLSSGKEINQHKEKLIAQVAAVRKKFDLEPLNWAAILRRASYMSTKLPGWTRVIGDAKAVKQADVLKVVKQVCGQPPRFVTQEQYLEIKYKLGIAGKALTYHLLNLGYTRKQSLKKADEIIDFYYQQAQKAETLEDLDALKKGLCAAVTAAREKIGLAPLLWAAIFSRANRLGLRWPRRPSVFSQTQPSYQRRPAENHWFP